MARQHVVTALERKYVRLLGFQMRLRQRSLSLVADLEHIEAVIRLFDPAWDKASVKPVAPKFPSRWRKKGEGVRAAFTVIKAAQRPLSATEIAREAFVVAGSNDELRLVGTDLIYSLRNHLGGRLVGVGVRPVRWVLALNG
jgi:hypothetical protein